jgi:hypothetical protein
VFKWWDALDAGSLQDCYDWSQVPLIAPQFASQITCLFLCSTGASTG